MRKVQILLFAIMIMSCAVVSGQHYHRVKADFSFKYKNTTNESSSLVMGKVYFDKTIQQITYAIEFPFKEIWVLKDTTMHKYIDGVETEKIYVPSPVETSVFNLSLQSGMNNFALENSFYKMDQVEEDGDLVIATWLPPQSAGKGQLGKVLVANKNGKLAGVVFKDSEDQVIAKQIYSKYISIGDIVFPTEVIQINIVEEKENYQITTYRNIILDEKGEDHWYRYHLD